MGNQNGDGMDGGKFGNQNWGGGRFSFQLCFQGTVYILDTFSDFLIAWHIQTQSYVIKSAP